MKPEIELSKAPRSDDDRCGVGCLATGGGPGVAGTGGGGGGGMEDAGAGGGGGGAANIKYNHLISIDEVEQHLQYYLLQNSL